ncbi:MAG: shikimate dehydrogenase [Betaproteobacteria bacterium]
MTDRYAVFGNPVSHSKSPLIHGTFARETRQDLTYEAIEAPLDGFAAAVADFRAHGGRGMNVTMPFKQEAFALATDLSERARQAGAVNALKFEGDRVLAENFDGLGLVNDIQRNCGFPIAGKRVLLLGAGGAVRGALLPILEQKPGRLTVANRTVAKAKALDEQFSRFGPLVTGGYPDIGNESFDIVINATSASMRGELPPVAPSAFAAGCLAYDLVYGKGLNPFLRLARDSSAGSLADGVGMLVEQAAEGFLWWRGVRPGTSTVIGMLKVPLA